MPPPDYTKMDRNALLTQLERQDRIIASLLRHIRRIADAPNPVPPPLSKLGKKAMEKCVVDTVNLCNGDKVAAAKIIGVCVKTVYNYLNRNELGENFHHDSREIPSVR